MVNSILLERHFYYLLYFTSSHITDKQHLAKLLSEKQYVENVNELGLIHTQKKYTIPFASELLKENKVEGEENDIWIDFFVNSYDYDGRKLFMICYPYKFLESYFLSTYEISNGQFFFHPQPEPIISDLKKDISLFKNGKASIIKFKASLSDSSKTESLVMTGRDPLNSAIYDYLEDSEFNIDPLSVVMNLSNDKLQKNMNVSFDIHGNVKFWLPPKQIKRKGKTVDNTEKYQGTFDLLNDIYEFFNVSNCFKKEVVRKQNDDTLE